MLLELTILLALTLAVYLTQPDTINTLNAQSGTPEGKTPKP